MKNTRWYDLVFSLTKYEKCAATNRPYGSHETQQLSPTRRERSPRDCSGTIAKHEEEEEEYEGGMRDVC